MCEKRRRMKNVTVSKHDLVAILKKNRSTHRSAFEKAFRGYCDECIKVLEENLEALRRGEPRVVVFNERAPEDHTSDYDRVLAMLDMSVDSNVQLSNEEFANYVQDDWDWKRVWGMINTKYLSR